MGMKWFSEMRVETLGRNFAVAGALAFSYRLGRAHEDFERVRLTARVYDSHGRPNRARDD